VTFAFPVQMPDYMAHNRPVSQYLAMPVVNHW
jgi:hypothetical protein